MIIINNNYNSNHNNYNDNHYNYYNYYYTITAIVITIYQGHPTNLFLTSSAPRRNIVSWRNVMCSDQLVGKFLIARGFGCELLTFSGNASRTGQRNSNQFYLAGRGISNCQRFQLWITDSFWHFKRSRLEKLQPILSSWSGNFSCVFLPGRKEEIFFFPQQHWKTRV